MGTNQRLLAATTVLGLCVSSVVWGYSTFGYRGQNGYNGRSGQSGYDGRPAVIVANGSPQRVDLSGSDGSPGENGTYGSDASNCYQPRPATNLIGAEGGDGGIGGNGGSGGDAGRLEVYFADPVHLRSVLVVQQPGRGGYPGQGSQGGHGCYCQQSAWQIQQCTTPAPTPTDPNPKPVCTNTTYTCQHGQDGRYGTQGSPGSAGSTGSVILIPQLDPLKSENPDAEIAMELTAGSGATEDLSRNLWQTRSGTASLFAPGSLINSTYSYYTGRAEERAQVVWNDPSRAASDLAGERVYLGLIGKGRIDARTDSAVWARISETVSGGVIVKKLDRVIRESEATRVRYSKISGTGTGLALELADDAGLSGEVATQVDLEWKKDKTFGDKKLWDQALPQDLIQVTGKGTVVLQIGKLPVDPKYLASGEKLSYELVIRRSFDGHSATQKKIEFKAKNP